MRLRSVFEKNHNTKYKIILSFIWEGTDMLIVST